MIKMVRFILYSWVQFPCRDAVSNLGLCTSGTSDPGFVPSTAALPQDTDLVHFQEVCDAQEDAAPHHGCGGKVDNQSQQVVKSQAALQ